MDQTLKLLREQGATILSSQDKKTCAAHVLSRLRSGFEDTTTLSAELLSFPLTVREGLMAYLTAVRDGQKPKNADVVVVKDILRNDLSRYVSNAVSEVIPLGQAAGSPTRKRSYDQAALDTVEGSLQKRAKLTPPSSQQIKSKKPLSQHTLIKFQRCTAKTAFDMLESIDFGDLVCSKLGLDQWQENGTGPLATLYQRVSQLRRDAVGRVLKARYAGATNKPAAKRQTAATSDEQVFSVLLRDLKDQKDGQLPLKKEILPSNCKGTLEESLSFVSDSRQGQSGKACLDELLRVIGARPYEARAIPSVNEVNLTNQFTLLEHGQKQSVRTFLEKILPNTKMTHSDKERAVKNLLDLLDTQMPLKKQRAQARADQHRQQQDEQLESEIESAILLGKEVANCGTELGQTLATLNRADITDEQKQRCAQKALTVLHDGIATEFYQELGQLGTTGSPKQKEQAAQFVATLRLIQEGAQVGRVQNPRLSR